MGDRNRSDLLGRRDDPASASHGGGLPHPWEKHFDDEYQSFYYFNPETQETQWAAVDDQVPFVPNERHFEDHNGYDESEPYEFGDEYSLNELDGDASVSNMSRLSQLSVIERSEHMLAVKREKQENLRQQLLQREEEELRDPEINKRSKQLNRNVDDIFAWEEQRKARMEALAAQQRAAEAAQNTGRPILYASSGASVSSHNSSDSAAHLPVEARLLAYEEKRKLKLQQTIAQEKNEARRAAIPTIAPHSSNLVQRRVAAAARGEEAPQLSNRRIAAGDTPGILKDNVTGQTFFQPKLNRKSEQIASHSRPSNVPIEDLLVGKGRLQQQKQAEREKRLDQRAHEMRQVSKVNPRSELLVQERYILQGETTQDRLARPIGTVKQKTLEEIERPTFKPTLNPVSIEMTMNNGYNVYGVDPRGHNSNNYNGGGEGPHSPQDEALARFNSMYTSDDYSVDHGEPLLYEDLIRGKHNNNTNNNYTNNNYNSNNASYMYDASQSLAPQDAMYSKTQRWSEMRNQKLEKERRERERKEAEMCTFKPKIEASSRGVRGGTNSHNSSFTHNNRHTGNNSNNSYYQDDEADGGSGGGSIGAYLERQLTWVEKRDQKLEQERRKAAEKELADCSFAPKLIVNPNISVSNSSIVERVGAGSGASGVGGSVKPTNTTFGSNIYTSNSNTPAGVQNIRRGGAAVAKVAYNASKARGSNNNTNYNDEGPFYASDEPTSTSTNGTYPTNATRTNKYYTANTAYDEGSDEDVPPPPATTNSNTSSEYSSGRIPLPLPARIPITRQTTQPNTVPNTTSSTQYHTHQHYQPEHHYQDQEREQGGVGQEEEEQYVPPARIKVPLPTKALPVTTINNTTINTTTSNTMSPNSYRKNVHFSSHNEEQQYNPHTTHTTHSNNPNYQDQEQDDEVYYEQGPHEVTIDYGSGEGSGYGSGSGEGSVGVGEDGNDVDSDCYDESRYNGLPFQVSNGGRGVSNGGNGSNGRSGSGGSPHSPTGGSLSHQLFPPTPHQHQQMQGNRPAPYATQNTAHTTSAASKIAIGARPNHTFVEPADDEYGSVSLFDVSTLSPPVPARTTQSSGGSGGKPQRPAAPPAHLRGGGAAHYTNTSSTKAHSPLSSHRLYEDPDAPPPPPPPAVFQPSQPRTSSNTSVVITGRNGGTVVGGAAGGTTGTPYSSASRGVDQLRSPEEDWYPHNDDEY